MKSTAENLSPTRVRLSVEVPFEELKPALDAAYKKIGAQIKVPGFRPGKVPQRVIDQRVGRAAVVEEAVNETVPRKYVEAAREHDVQALGQPEISVTSDVATLADNESLNFTAEVDIRPEIELPELTGIAITVEDVEVSDADIDEQLDGLRERFGTLTAVDRPIETGDYVSIDLTASIDGEQVEAGSAKGMSYAVGSGDLVDGLDDAILGKSAGDTATFTAALQAGGQAGDEAQIEVSIGSVKTKELPAADDEFAQLASEFDTIDELRADLRDRLGRAKRMAQGTQARDHLVDHLLESIDFPVPESAVTGEVEYREHEIVHSLGHDDSVFDRYLEMQGQTREQFTAELREAAEKSVRMQLILDAVAERTEVQIGDAELTEYLVHQAGRYNMAPREFADQVVQGGNLPAIIADVRRNKALSTVLEASVVTDSSGNAVDLASLVQQAADEPAAPVDDDEA